MGTGNTDQESYCRINTDLLFNNAHRLASVCFRRSASRHSSHGLPYRSGRNRLSDPGALLAVGAAIESGFIVKMAIVTLSHNCFPPDKEILRIIQNHPWFFTVLTVAPFSGFVQVALAPISQKLCGAPAPIRIFRRNHGEIPLISSDPDSLGLLSESPTPIPKAFHPRKGHSTCHPPLRTGVYQTRNCRYPLAPSQM